jgi:hypothetical protein
LHPFVYIRNKLEERRATREQENPADSAARRTTTATVWMAVFTGVLTLLSLLTLGVLKNQLKEMQAGGIDTHALAQASEDAAVAAQQNAQAAASFAQSAEGINRRTSEAVTQFRHLADATTKAAIAAKSGADTAARELELAERPWVDAQMVIDGPFEFNLNGVNVHFKFQLVNTGHSPAVAVNIHPFMVSAFSTGPTAEEARNQTCSGASQTAVKRPGFGVTLFPNHPFEESLSFGMGKDDIAKASQRIPGQIIWPNLVVCIAYRSTFSDRVYHTAYVLDLLKIDSEGNQRVDFKIGEDVDKDHLRFRCSGVNCIAAD